MSEVKIYTLVSDELSPPVIGESFCTDMVRHSDYAELEQKLTGMAVQLANAESKCRELAAELSAVDKIHNEAVFITDDHYEQCPPEVQKMIRSLAVLQIPAYQAFLAEVRAQGVEMFALMFAEEAIKDNNITTGWKARASRAASEYAELLREGADK
ncbi:hypothetical protein [Citrobacter sp. Res13-Sevr-PEB04-36]|uniref:hypothetical protein n=1 Tax=Citrobacter sp. Res13-Sevr-PEB04-36 TaxID=2777960 RepID=UPI0018AC93BB|nr:hypothetical protein [Citrobacter sp. Res13-Sevr-PEB04-36]